MYDFAPILSRIKAVKKASGLTNDELAAKSGVPVGTLRKILSGGTQEPKLPALMAIAAALDTSVDYLVYGREPTISAQLSKDEIDLVDNFRELNAEGQEKVRAYVDDLIRTGIYKKHGKFGMVSKEAKKYSPLE